MRGWRFTKTHLTVTIGFVECPPVCAIFCEYGNVEDENGCPICECSKYSIKCGCIKVIDSCLWSLVNWIKSGPVVVGIATLRCNYKWVWPLANNILMGVAIRRMAASNYIVTWKFVWPVLIFESGCSQWEILYSLDTAIALSICLITFAEPKPCPPVCKIFCEYGNVEDENGCATCECSKYCVYKVRQTVCVYLDVVASAL